MEEVAVLRRLIDRADAVLVAGHCSPDGDCVGAMLALALALDRLGKRRSLVLPDPVPDLLDFLPDAAEIAVSPSSLPAADLVIIPDCSDLERLGTVFEAHPAFFAAVPVVNVDHHVSNRLFGTVNLVDPAAAAVCEQLAFLLPALHVPIDVAIATCLLTGIVTDTQTFRTPNTTARTMRVATGLMEAGAPLAAIADRVYNSRPLSTLRLWGLALSRLREDGGVIWTHLDEGMLREAGASWAESEPLVNLLSSVRSAEVVVLFKVMPEGPIRVSLRSNGRLDMAAIAAQFGGGGHQGAAGCSIAEPLAVAEELILARVRKSLDFPV